MFRHPMSSRGFISTTRGCRMMKHVGNGKFIITTKCDSSSSELLVVREPAPTDNLTTSDSSLFAHSAVSQDFWRNCKCEKMGQGHWVWYEFKSHPMPKKACTPPLPLLNHTTYPQQGMGYLAWGKQQSTLSPC